jgi:uncharacterized protein YdeI (YjbR/CyaY-like superfamily)
MKAGDCTFFETRAAFRAWLEAHHDRFDVLEIGFYKKGSGLPSVTYLEALEEALCFGWIDGVRHAIDEKCFAQRFTPRRTGSNWSTVNIKRVERLMAQGLMQESGLRAFEARDLAAPRSEDRADVLTPEYLVRLQASAAAWAFFSTQAPWYRRTCALWVMDAKREETRERRLQTLIADSQAGRRIKPLAGSGGTANQ